MHADRESGPSAIILPIRENPRPIRSEKKMSIRTLALVLGDQLDRKSALWDGFDPERDAVWMAEVSEESTHVWTHKVRIAFFLAAMRHFRDELAGRGYRVDYRELDEDPATLAGALRDAIARLKPERLAVVHPGEWRVRDALRAVA